MVITDQRLTHYVRAHSTEDAQLLMIALMSKWPKADFDTHVSATPMDDGGYSVVCVRRATQDEVDFIERDQRQQWRDDAALDDIDEAEERDD